MRTITIPMESLAELIIVQLKENGRANLTVTGSSMMPMLYSRKDSVQLIPAAEQQKVGDVILYRRENGKYILHRIIGMSEQGYICCGDNQAEKEPVMHEQLVAVVDGFTRKGKIYTMENTLYRMYTFVMVKMYFLRPAYIALRRRLGRLRSRRKKK